MGLLDRQRSDVVALHAVMFALERYFIAIEEPLDDRHSLRETLDPGGSSVKAKPGLLIFRPNSSRAETELKPSVR